VAAPPDGGASAVAGQWAACPSRDRRRAARQTCARLIAQRAPASRPPPRGGGRFLKSLSETADSCRVDVWLWRARFFKTRSLAARVIEEGGVRLTRGGARTPLEKPSRTVRCGDVLAFPQGPRWLAVKVEAVGVRRGPAPEARALYSLLDDK
jgi:ribosome-associated heat shock protein Hsp15